MTRASSLRGSDGKIELVDGLNTLAEMVGQGVAFLYSFGIIDGVNNRTYQGGAVIFVEIDNTLHCTFTDRLDGHVCATIEKELLCRIAEFKNLRDNARIVFDLDGVIFISSAFLRICLIQLKTFGKDNFIVTNAAEEIFKVFYVSGFVEIMNVVPQDPIT